MTENIITVAVAILASPLILSIFNRITFNKRNSTIIINKIDDLDLKVQSLEDNFNNYKIEQIKTDLEKKIMKMLEMSVYTPSCIKEFYTLLERINSNKIILEETIIKKIEKIDEIIRKGEK